MDTSTFYATSSALCFALLGFWWVVVEFRHSELTRDATTRRFTFLVSLHFVIPGLVSLAALLAPGTLWRVVFAVAGVTGLAAVIAGIGIGTRAGPLRSLGRAAWLGIPIYALVAITALLPDMPRSLGLEPLQAEGFLLLAILLLGILLAWLMFTGPLADEHARDDQ